MTKVIVVNNPSQLNFTCVSFGNASSVYSKIFAGNVRALNKLDDVVIAIDNGKSALNIEHHQLL